MLLSRISKRQALLTSGNWQSRKVLDGTFQNKIKCVGMGPIDDVTNARFSSLYIMLKGAESQIYCSPFFRP